MSDSQKEEQPAAQTEEKPSDETPAAEESGEKQADDTPPAETSSEAPADDTPATEENTDKPASDETPAAEETPAVEVTPAPEVSEEKPADDAKEDGSADAEAVKENGEAPAENGADEEKKEAETAPAENGGAEGEKAEEPAKEAEANGVVEEVKGPFSGTYVHVKSVKLEPYLSALGVAWFRRQGALKFHPSMDITQKGDDFKIKMKTFFLTKNVSFKIGEEFSDKDFNSHTMKVVSTMEDGKLVQTVEPAVEGKGKSQKITREIKDNELVMTMECGDIVCERHFKKKKWINEVIWKIFPILNFSVNVVS